MMTMMTNHLFELRSHYAASSVEQDDSRDQVHRGEAQHMDFGEDD
jgi:hypothetical protein